MLNRRFYYEILESIRSVHPNRDGLKMVNEVGKSQLIDGRSGEPYEEQITVGVAYILKLNGYAPGSDSLRADSLHLKRIRIGESREPQRAGSP